MFAAIQARLPTAAESYHPTFGSKRDSFRGILLRCQLVSYRSWCHRSALNNGALPNCCLVLGYGARAGFYCGLVDPTGHACTNPQVELVVPDWNRPCRQVGNKPIDEWIVSTCMGYEHLSDRRGHRSYLSV
jgi:hypothetical protein